MTDTACTLLPCPFCGEGGSMVECYMNDNRYWSVGCGRCGAHSGSLPDTAYKNARERVIKSWNSRPAQPEPAEFTKAISQLWKKIKPSKEAQSIRAGISLDSGKYNVPDEAFLPEYVWDLCDIAAQMALDAKQPEPAAEVVERVAMSLAANDYQKSKEAGEEWPEVYEDCGLYAAESWETYESMAKAAIAALPQAQPVIPPGDVREAYHTMHVNFLHMRPQIDGLNIFEKYLRYRATGQSHEHSFELAKKPYAEHSASPSTAIEGQKL